MRYRMEWFTKNSCGFIVLLFAVFGWVSPLRAQDTGAISPVQPVGEATLEQAGEPARQAEDSGTKDYSPFPQPDVGYVTDLANLLTLNEEERIERWLWQTEEKTGVEIIVVTIGSIKDYPGAPMSSIEDFAAGLFNTYGIGNMPANNGVLLLVAANDRKARIELGAGYGRARDGDAMRIMNEEIIPHFRQEDYAEGIRSGVKAVMHDFAGLGVRINWPLIGLLAAIPVVAVIAVSLFKNGKKGWGWVCVGLLIVLVLLLIRILITMMRVMPRGGAGGLGGFGGGSSGGGGATGSW